MMIALVQILIKYALFLPYGLSTSLNTFGFLMLVLATVCIAAAGNIINDIYDFETDLVNKPDKVIVGKSISEKMANNLFIIFNVIGVGLGFYISNWVGKSSFFAVFVIISAFAFFISYLYLYLKGK